MPLPLAPALQTIVDSGHFEAHDTLSIIFKDGTIRHFATADITGVSTPDFGTINYSPELRDVNTLDESLTLETDAIEMSVQNVDEVIGQTAIGQPRALNGATGIFGTVFVASDGTKYYQEIIRGEIWTASAPDPDARFTLISDLSLPGPVAGWRPLQQHCTIPKFKGPGCSSPDPSTTCNRKLDSANGCRAKQPAPQLTTPIPIASKGNDGRFQGYVFLLKDISGTDTNLNNPGGTFDDGNDFNTYRRERELAGGYTGRNDLPLRPLDY